MDGSCEPQNPGGNGVAGAVLYANGLTDGRSRYLGSGSYMSNNVAEYAGLRLGLEICREHNITSNFTIYSDSQLVVNQMNGRWKAIGRKLYTQVFLDTKEYFYQHFNVPSIKIKWVAGIDNPADAYTRTKDASDFDYAVESDR